MTNTRIVEAINSEKNCDVFVKNACGYVQNIPAVACAAGGTVLIASKPSEPQLDSISYLIPDPPSNELIALI